MSRLFTAGLVAALALAPLGATSALAKGCVKGAAVGGAAGHVAGHHSVAGAGVGCAVGHHEANKETRQPQQTQGPGRSGSEK